MTSYPQNGNTNENGNLDEIKPDEFDEFEDDLLKKKKVRLNSKYSEKRYIP